MKAIQKMIRFALGRCTDCGRVKWPVYGLLACPACELKEVA